MPNTNLPTSVQNGQNHHEHHNVIHAEINNLSRQTDWVPIPLINGWKLHSGGYAQIRRLGRYNTIQLKGLDASEATADHWAKFAETDDGQSLHVGFRCAAGSRSPFFPTGPAATAQLVFFSNPGNLLFCSNRAALDQATVFEWTYFATHNPLPTFPTA